jgi:hypothetical protein
MSTAAATLDQDVWRNNMLSGLTRQATAGGLGSVDAQKQAYARIYDLVQLQAASLAYVDTFMVLTVISGIMFFLAFILKKNDLHSGGHVAVERVRVTGERG